MLIEVHCDIQNRCIVLNWIQDREQNYLACVSLGLIEGKQD